MALDIRDEHLGEQPAEQRREQLGERDGEVLQHVFDPPPDHLAVRWGFLAGLGGAAVAGGLLAAALAGLQIRRLPLGAIFREE
jgi:hypothetical protein